MAGKIQNEDIKSSAELIAGGGTAAQLPNDDKVYVTANSVNKTLKQAIIDGEIGGGGGGGKNYLTKYKASLGAGAINTGNGDFEANATTGWSLFNTTLTSGVPSGSITAGAASLTTFAATGSGPLQKVYSLSVASSGAVTAGHGFLSDAFYIDKEDQAQILGVSFAYSVVSGTSNLNLSGTSSNTWQVYLYDVTNSAWIQPIGVYDVKATAGILSASFQTSSNGTQYRVALVACNASAGAMSMLFDDFSCGPLLMQKSGLSVVAKLSGTTSTITNSGTSLITWTTKEIDRTGTLSFTSFTAKEAGDYLVAANFKVSVTGGGGSGQNISITIFKNGVLVASNSVPSINTGTFLYNPSVTDTFSLKAGDIIEIKGDQQAAVGTFATSGGSFTVTKIMDASFNSVGNVIAAKMSTTATTSFTSGANVKMVWNGNSFDTVGTMVDTANSRIYIPVAGDYECDMSYFFSAATGVTTGAIQVKAYVNGVDHTLVGFEALVAGNFNRSVSASGILRGLKAGDYVELYIYQDSGVALPGLGSLNGFSLKKIPSDSAAIALEKPGMVLIKSQTVSNVASVDFDITNASAYSQYILVADKVIPQTNATNGLIRISTGSGYLVINYDHRSFRWTSIATGVGGATGDTSLNLTGGGETFGTGGSQSVSFEAKIFGADSTTPIKRATWAMEGYWASSTYVSINGSGTVITNSAAIDGVRFFMSSGNVASGTFSLYGIKR